MLRMGIDEHAVGDAQAVRKGELMLESTRVEACSYLRDNSGLYLTNICRAVMKKGVVGHTGNFETLSFYAYFLE